MDWKTEAVDKLMQYDAKRQSFTTIPMQIAEIDMELTSIRSARTDGTPVKGGGSKYEDRILNCIVRKDELTRILERTQMWVDTVDRGLSVLNSDERLVLDRLIIFRERYAADRLASELFADVKTIYKWREKALRKFTIALYGVTES